MAESNNQPQKEEKKKIHTKFSHFKPIIRNQTWEKLSTDRVCLSNFPERFPVFLTWAIDLKSATPASLHSGQLTLIEVHSAAIRRIWDNK